MEGQKRSIRKLLTSLFLLVVLIGGTWSNASGAGVTPSLSNAQPAFVVPTFNIVSVNTDQSVTIKTYNFPANDTFNVLMNYMGTHGVGGINVATVNSGSGGTFTATYNIPDALKGQKQIAIRLESPTSGYYAYNWFWNNTSSGIPVSGPGLPSGVIPTFNISSVEADSTVTIKTYNFPANDTFDVLMNYMGTRGVGGILVDTIDSGTGGTMTMTFNIPDALKGQKQIAIRLESPTSGYYAYNWFWNNTTGGVPVTGGTLPPGVIPTFSITDVTQDTSVTIKTSNLPANDTFDVLMNYIGTRGVGGILVDTINSGSGGTMTMTFNIPDALKGQQQIAIRLESNSSGYYAYNWFWNNTTGGVPVTGATATPGPSATPFVVPTFTITGVQQDQTVSIQTANFPANDTFNVTMGDYGTRGVGGINVGTFNSGSGGTLTGTFNIPDALKGSDRIAIRLESPTSGYFAYNWFWNNTYP